MQRSGEADGDGGLPRRRELGADRWALREIVAVGEGSGSYPDGDQQTDQLRHSLSWQSAAGDFFATDLMRTDAASLVLYSNLPRECA